MSAEWEYLSRLPFFQGLDPVQFANELPELTEDIAIEYAGFQLTVAANGEPQGMEGRFELSGKDEDGNSHRIEIQGAGTFRDVNETTPDGYDPAAHTLETIDYALFDDHN